MYQFNTDTNSAACHSQKRLSWLKGVSNLVGLKGSFLRASPAGIKEWLKKEENLEIGQENLPQGLRTNIYFG